MKSYVIALFVLVGGIGVLPANALGSGISYAATDTIALFSVNINFSTGAEETRLPIGAKIGITSKDNVDLIGYNLQSKTPSDNISVKTSGLLLADLPVEGSYYVLAPYTQADFTLYVIADIENTAPTESDLYRITVSELPYYVGSNRTRSARESIAKLVSDTIMLPYSSTIE